MTARLKGFTPAVAKRLKQHRELRGLSQAELQSLQRVSNSPYRFREAWLDRWMAGEEPPRKLQSLRRSA